MHSRYILAVLLAGAVAAPAGGQDRPAERERRIYSFPRILEAARAPRAVLGIATSVRNGLADTAGVLVAEVVEGGPAARAGIAAGARLVEIDGTSLRMSPADAEDPLLAGIGSRRLTRELGRKNPGDEVELRVAANGQVRTVRVRLADADSLHRRRELPRARARTALREAAANRATLGIHVGAIASPRDTLGVFVTGVNEDGPAARAGIIEGNRIAAINGVDLRVARADANDPIVARARVRQLLREMGEAKPGDEVELRVWQNGQYRTVRVRTVPADSLRGALPAMRIGGVMDGLGPGGALRVFLDPEGRDALEGRRHRRVH